MAEIQARVAERYGITRREMISRAQERSISRPRQLSMTLCRALTNKSQTQVAWAHGKKDHTTVLHAERAVISRCHADPQFDRDIAMLAKELGA